MRIDLRYKLSVEPKEFSDIQRRISDALRSFDTRTGNLNKKPWSITVVNYDDARLFASLGEHDRAIWISERVEATCPRVLVSTPEDLYERTWEALEQIFKQ